MKFFAPCLCLRLKKHLDSVEMSPVRIPWRQDGRVFWNAGQTCPAAFVCLFFLMMFGSVRGDAHTHFGGDRRRSIAFRMELII